MKKTLPHIRGAPGFSKNSLYLNGTLRDSLIEESNENEDANFMPDLPGIGNNTNDFRQGTFILDAKKSDAEISKL